MARLVVYLEKRMIFAEKAGGKKMKGFIVVLIIVVIVGVCLGVAFCGKVDLFNSEPKSVTVTLATNGGEVSIRTLVGKPWTKRFSLRAI